MTTDGSATVESRQIDFHFCKQCKEITSHLTVERGVWNVFHFFDRVCLICRHIWHLGDDEDGMVTITPSPNAPSTTGGHPKSYPRIGRHLSTAKNIY